ncbi:hypothetical protein BC938DRAFT_472860 [Jimgerdemannia flammicorona]|uniref:Uncharacterized protein n=1 Tax=Jimgerdemannia flammicorona TaxID=994334 RepID=A0A433QZX1_9FUNG|nr:hypothetical protein BC938DRAFT_472860 [Jimgerdemannia flammicorona]
MRLIRAGSNCSLGLGQGLATTATVHLAHAVARTLAARPRGVTRAAESLARDPLHPGSSPHRTIEGAATRVAVVIAAVAAAAAAAAVAAAVVVALVLGLRHQMWRSVAGPGPRVRARL